MVYVCDFVRTVWGAVIRLATIERMSAYAFDFL